MTEFTPLTKRLMLCFLGVGCLSAIAGTAWGNMDFKDALIIISPIITGFFTLLKGE